MVIHIFQKNDGFLNLIEYIRNPQATDRKSPPALQLGVRQFPAMRSDLAIRRAGDTPLFGHIACRPWISTLLQTLPEEEAQF